MYLNASVQKKLIITHAHLWICNDEKVSVLRFIFETAAESIEREPHCQLVAIVVGV